MDLPETNYAAFCAGQTYHEGLGVRNAQGGITFVFIPLHDKWSTLLWRRHHTYPFIRSPYNQAQYLRQLREYNV
jgi:hypothetical protein